MSRTIRRAPAASRSSSAWAIVAQRPAPLVAVQPLIAAGDVVVGEAGLAGAGDAHDHHHVRVPVPPAARRAAAAALHAGPGRRGVRRRPPGRHRSASSSAARGGAARGLRAAGAGDGDHAWGRGTAATPVPPRRAWRRDARRDLCERLAPAPATGARRGPPSGEWAMSAIPSSAQRSTRPPRSGPSSRTLSATWTAADRRERERLVELAAVDVGEPDAGDEAVGVQPGQRAHRRRPRRARVGRVQEVGVDRQAVKGGEARLAVCADGLGPAVGHPGAARAGHAALGDDAGAALGAAASQRAGQQPLVVAELGLASSP